MRTVEDGRRLDELAAYVGAELRGDGEKRIQRVATLNQAGALDISFLANARYKKQLRATAAGAVIVAPQYAQDCPVDALVTRDPYVAFAKIATLLNPPPSFEPGVHGSAVMHPSVTLGAGVYVGPHVVLGKDVEVGDGTYIGPGCIVEDGTCIGVRGHLVARVTLCHGTQIGARVLLHPGVVIGSDGFGQANEGGRWIKVPQLGRVIIGDDVEIGANTTIDRGALEDTRIEDGVRLDNLIQVAHNVVIGAHTAIAACVGIAGSTKIGRHCALGGGVGIAGHLEIADGVQVTAMSLITHSIREAGVYSSGVPFQENAQWQKNCVRFKQLDDMARRLKSLERLGRADSGAAD